MVAFPLAHLAFPHLTFPPPPPRALPRLALPCPFFCLCLSLRALPLSLRDSLLSALPSLLFSSVLLFSFLFFRCFSSPADSGNFFSFRGASRCPQPVDKLLLHAPRLWALLWGCLEWRCDITSVSLLETRLESSLCARASSGPQRAVN